MNHLHLSAKHLQGTHAEIDLPSSKSLSNRVLIIKELCEYSFNVINLSEANDTLLLKNVLSNYKNSSVEVFDAEDAGTTFRFLTALFSITEGKRILTGSDRMKERPIKPLVDVLIQLGANIRYLEKEGFAPIEIHGQNLRGGSVFIDSSISSQFISALLLIAPAMQEGLTILFDDKTTVSKSYINMTLGLMERFGIKYASEPGKINIFPHQQYVAKDIEIEADWSAASYWFQWCSFIPQSTFLLKKLDINSLQGDAICAYIYRLLGLEVTSSPEGLIIQHKRATYVHHFTFNFKDCPDLVQTLAATCTGNKIKGYLKGVETLVHKETNRLQALQNELKKVGVFIETGHIMLQIKNFSMPEKKDILINTYNDHRMAMCMAPLSVFYDLTIENPEVVKKSYPGYWQQVEKMMGK